MTPKEIERMKLAELLMQAKTSQVINGQPVKNPNAVYRKPPSTIGIRG